MMHYSDMAQGFQTDWLVLIAAQGASIKPILKLTTTQDPNDALCVHSGPADQSCVHYSVEYRFVPKPQSDYFDIVATKTLESGKHKGTSSNETFSFVAGKYISPGTTRR